ncbi:predicted protein [Histoplasma mississippiense (nom. inval.)]|uniref:predicted protein n=1 Tax=Ajellomyces capsulatus (strain NAm1 / WU24) TaxID=2059318 RepID=UPI000157B4A2|nr:predicted protein [Histoplasma mississippiense (nom. inval.)]EDN03031.1 predicted protein [Histoplasma mississippiense (nom. inval.)]
MEVEGWLIVWSRGITIKAFNKNQISSHIIKQVTFSHILQLHYQICHLNIKAV